MEPKANGQHQPASPRRAAQPTAMPCTSPWTEPYQFSFADDRRSSQSDDQDLQPTHDALSHIYNRGYV